MKFTWISPSGISLEFSKDSENYKLMLGYDGLSKILCNHITQQAPYQAGSTRVSTHLTERLISIPVMITAPDLINLRAATRNLSILLNPEAGPGTLVFTDADGSEYSITAIGNGTPDVSTTNRSGTQQLANIDLIAHNPYWYSYPRTIVHFGTAAALHFPLTFPITFPGLTGTQTVMNYGDTPSEVTIVVTGGVTNPAIRREYSLSTGGVPVTETISFTLEMLVDDILTITTGFGNKTLSLYHAATGLYDTNPFQYLDQGSTFWSLVPGENRVSVSNTAFVTGLTTTVEAGSKYSGI